jgi:RNA polymerase sigma-70 factor, ECF subfamily
VADGVTVHLSHVPLLHCVTAGRTTTGGVNCTNMTDAPLTGGSVPDRQAIDDLFSAAYEELRRLASTIRRDDPSVTLTPTTLVNEAWLKLAAYPRFACVSRLHFKRIVGRAMRQVLVEAARRRNAAKRGGGALVVTLDDSSPDMTTTGDQLLALHTALDDLGRVQPRQAAMVECRFFGGLELSDIAELLDVSEATIQRDWRAARAWLAKELRHAATPGGKATHG